MILVESPNPFITKEAHQYKRILILQVALHTTYRGSLGAHAYIYVYCSFRKIKNQRSKACKVWRRSTGTSNGLSALARKPIALGRALAGRGWEVVRPVHQVLPLQGPIILKRRVWSWLRRNASYMLNTCKSNVVFGELGRRKRCS